MYTPKNDFSDDIIEGNEMPKIINIQKKLKHGLVKLTNGTIVHVSLQDWLLDGIELYDYVELKKSHVSKEWIVIDYHVNTEVAGSIHNSYQTRYEDLVTDERGVPL